MNVKDMFQELLQMEKRRNVSLAPATVEGSGGNKNKNKNEQTPQPNKKCSIM